MTAQTAVAAGGAATRFFCSSCLFDDAISQTPRAAQVRRAIRTSIRADSEQPMVAVPFRDGEHIVGGGYADV